MRRIWVMMIIIVIASIYVLGVHLPYQLVLVHGYMGTSTVWTETHGQKESFLDKICKNFEFEDIKLPSLYKEWKEEKKTKPWEKASIEEFGDLLYNNHIKPADTESIIIAHSMGGLFARCAALEDKATKTENRKIKGIITMGTPHLGAPVANKLNWWLTCNVLNALVHAPLLLDKYKETRWVKRAVSEIIITIATIILAFFIAIFLAEHFKCSVRIGIGIDFTKISADILAKASLILVFVTLSCFVINVDIPKQGEQAAGGWFMTRLNLQELPAVSGDGLSTFYASIYGLDSDLFRLVKDHNIDKDGVMKTASAAFASLYISVGTYHIVRSFFGWNRYRFFVGCTYIACGVGMSPPLLSSLYNIGIVNGIGSVLNMLLSGAQSDGFIPQWSQIMPDYVVPKIIRDNGLYFKEPAPKDNHETETWGNSQSVEKVIGIFDGLLLIHKERFPIFKGVPRER